MKDVITVIAALFIIFLVVDGIRRARNSRNGKIRISPNMKKRMRSSSSGDDEDAADYSSELPNGGARVANRQAANERVGLFGRKPEQASLNLREPVPMLMDEISDNSGERIEPVFSAAQPASHYENEAQDYNPQDYDADYEEEEADPLFSDVRREDDSDEYDDQEDDLYESDEDYEEDELVDEYVDEHYEDEDYEEEPDDQGAEPVAKTETRQQTPEEVLVINVMAQNDQMLNGAELLDAVLRCGMRFGDMDIFHRYSDKKGEGALLFSMANMVKPGTFDLDAMDEFETPGVCLFMTLPINAESMPSFELMLDTANTIAESLGAEVRDEQRILMTKQRIDHSRERIRDYDRRKLFQRRR